MMKGKAFCLVTLLVICLYFHVGLPSRLLNCIPADIRGVYREIWANIANHAEIIDLKNDPRYPSTPTEVNEISTFKTPSYSSPYGQRLQAYFSPPKSGRYWFQIECNRQCKLTVQTINPVDKLVDITATSPHPHTRRYPTNLDSGVMYLIQVIHTSRYSGAKMELKIKIPGESTYRFVKNDYIISKNADSSPRPVSLMGDWATWSLCSVTCGQGTSTRHRACADKPEIVEISQRAANETANETRACVTNVSCSANVTPPENVTAYNTSATSVVVSWSSVTVTAVTGYSVTLNESISNTFFQVRLNETKVTFEDLEKFRVYTACITVLLHRVSTGKRSCIDVKTDEDVPSLPPRNITARPTGPSSIRVTWGDVPEHSRNGVITRFVVRCFNGVTMVADGMPRGHWWEFNQLNQSTSYCIKVAARTRKGEGTEGNCVNVTTHKQEPCPCPPSFTTSWWVKPPYTMNYSTVVMSSQPSGVIAQSLSHMVEKVCGFCPSYGKTKILYGEWSSDTRKENVTQVLQQAQLVDFSFPVSDFIYTGFPSDRLVYVPVIRVPGFVLISGRKSASAYARTLAVSVFQCWPLLVVNLAMTTIAGIVIWILDSAYGTGQFPPSFVAGVREACWWSFVTMTTVGYGDRVPKSPLGRAFSVAWSLMGIVLSSLLVSAVTSSLVITVITENMDIEKGRKVGAMEDSEAYKVAQQMVGSVAKAFSYPSLETLANALSRGEVDGCLVDLHSASYYHLFRRKSFKVSHIINKEFTYGILIGQNASKLAKEFKEQIKMMSVDIVRGLQIVEKDVKKDQNLPPVQDASAIEFLNPETDMYKLTVLITGSLLVCVVIGGLVYHMTCYRISTSSVTSGFPERQEYLHAVHDLREMVTQFHDRYRQTYLEMKARHKYELLMYHKSRLERISKMSSSFV